jgi:hypothetical protein
MENATTPTWLKESLSAVRRAPSADPQATGALAFKRPPLPLLNACTRKVVPMVMTLAFAAKENRIQAASPTIARFSTVRTSLWLQSTHVNLCCSATKPTGVMSQSSINAWHLGHTRPLIVAALISVLKCDILHPLDTARAQHGSSRQSRGEINSNTWQNVSDGHTGAMGPLDE